LTIERGFGWQLKDWAHYSMEKSFDSEKYKEFKRKVYLDRHEIFRLLKAEDTSLWSAD